MNPTLPAWLLEQQQLRERVARLEGELKRRDDAAKIICTLCFGDADECDCESNLIARRIGRSKALAELAAAKDEIAKLKAEREKLTAFIRPIACGTRHYDQPAETSVAARALLAELGVDDSSSGGEG